MKKYALGFVVLLACLASLSGMAAQIGEPATRLAVKEWIKGTPVDVKAGTNIYVLEIWVTSSASCRAAITNFNAIQKQYKDKGVIVIGVSDEPAEKIKAFLQAEGAGIEYTIAADDEHRTARSYMMPAHQQGLPYAFVVGTNGHLLWHGGPTPELNQVLDQVAAGHYDIGRAAKTQLARRQMEQYLSLAGRADKRAPAAGRALLTLRTNDVELLCDLAFQIAVHPRLPKRDIALASEALDQAQKVATTNAARVDLTRAVLYFETGRTNEALALAKQRLAAAQNQQERDWAQSALRTMEARLKAPPTSRRNPSPPAETAPAANDGTPLAPAAPASPAKAAPLPAKE